MKPWKWILTAALGATLFPGTPALAQGHGNGHSKGHEKQEDEGRDDHSYKHHDEEIRGWYRENAGHLPPGLAKKDRLPPGLEKQLAVRGALPPGLQKQLHPVPVELERHLPPPPPECAHVLIGGNIVLLNRRTNIVVDVFHFEAL